MVHVRMAYSPRDPPPVAQPRLVGALQAPLPERYVGDPAGCRNFMFTCELYLSEFPELKDKQRIATLIQRLTGHAQEWAAGVWQSRGALATDFTAFMQQLREVFYHDDQGQSISQQLLWLQQGRASVAENSITFHILVADRGWNDPALLVHFRDGLRLELQLELACRGEGLYLNR